MNWWNQRIVWWHESWNANGKLPLRAAQELEKDYARIRQSRPGILTDEQRKLIRTLAENMPRLWKLPTTTNVDRQQIIRLLIERVNVTVGGNTDQVDVSLHWSGGFVSQHEFQRPSATINRWWTIIG